METITNKKYFIELVENTWDDNEFKNVKMKLVKNMWEP